MKRLLTATFLTAALVVLTGCQKGADTATTSTGSASGVATTNANTTSTEATPGVMKVSLSVPAMT